MAPLNLWNWVKGTLDRAKDRLQNRPADTSTLHAVADEPIVVPEPPALPDPRPRVLTPEPCQDVDPQQSILFTKLPSDIRRDILIMAFGRRAIHMDLVFDYPVKNVTAEEGSRAGPVYHVEEDKPKRWVWSGRLCMRNSCWMSIKPEHWTKWWNGPWRDTCRDYTSSQDIWTAPLTSKHRYGEHEIGVMGWLLSCRQAYMEGIEVLYETNLIHIRSPTLASRLDTMILPQRLATIRYLEISLTKYLRADDTAGIHKEPDTPENSLREILKCSPGLRRVFISVDCYFTGAWTLNSRRLGPQLFSDFMRDMDAFCRKQDHNLECPPTLALPSSATGPLKREASRVPDLELDKSASFLLWRCLDRPESIVQLRYSASYPRAPSRESELAGDGASASSLGYWIMEGSYVDPSQRYLPHPGCYYPVFKA